MAARKARKTPLPRLWLMTDERVETPRILAAASRLPRGSGIIVRHYGSSRDARRTLFDALNRIAVRRHHVLLLAGDQREARRWRADGVHGGRSRAAGGNLLHTVPVHDMRELRRAQALGPDAVFLSPVFPTRSHPGAPAIGTMRFATMARYAAVPVIALGGMNARRGRKLSLLGAYGWSAIDALT